MGDTMEECRFLEKPKKISPPVPNPYPLRLTSDARTVRAWNEFEPKHVHVGRPTKLVRMAVCQKTVATGSLTALLHLGGGLWPILPQVSLPMWTESRSQPRPPQSRVSSPNRLYLTQSTHVHTPVLNDEAGRPNLPALFGAAHADHVLTTTATSDNATPDSISSGKRNSKCTQQMKVPSMTHWLPANSDGDVILVASSGENDG